MQVENIMKLSYVYNGTGSEVIFIGGYLHESESSKTNDSDAR